MDEPTNHLDLQATEWLEGWLRGYPGAVLLVSHDRAFLGNFGGRVLDLRDGAVKSYPGPYEKYWKLRQEEEVRQTEVAKRQQQEIDKLDEYVRRFMNSQRTAQARGRLKQMDKLKAVAVTAPKQEKGMRASFGGASRSGDIVLSVEGLSMGFGSETLYKDLNWTVRYGERWGVVGENGAGKSTLIRNALGLLAPWSGKVRLGSHVGVGYFAQDTATLDPEVTPLDTLVYNFDLLPADARNLLSRFLLTGDDVYRPIKTLSGGEKNKLVLASLTTLHPNLLVLDEPTNHLDMASREALCAVLNEFKGTLILVSHDRWLLDQVTDHTFDLRRSGAVTYPASYGVYHTRTSSPAVPRAAPAPAKGGTLQAALKLAAGTATAEKPALSPRELSKEIARLERLVAELEDQVHEAEQELVDLENTLANLPPTADVLALTQSHSGLQEQIAGLMSTWEEQSEKLEQLRAAQ